MNSFLIWCIVAIGRDGLLAFWNGEKWCQYPAEAREYRAQEGLDVLSAVIAPGDQPAFLLPLAVADVLRVELEDLQSIPF